MNTGKGNITVNGKELEKYFPDESLVYIVRQPLEVTNTLANFDIQVNLFGGGIKGQAEALRLAISRALCKVDTEAYRSILKKNGFLTRDQREVERKKPVSRALADASNSVNVRVLQLTTARLNLKLQTFLFSMFLLNLKLLASCSPAENLRD